MVAFVAPYLLEATAVRPLGSSRTRCAAGLVTTESADNLSLTCGMRWRITGRSPMRWTPSRSPTPSGPQRSDRSGQAVDRRLGAVAGAAGPGTRGARHPGHGRGHRPERREKSRMKSVLRSAGIPCARHQLVTRTEEATSFLAEVGLPMVAKPPAGAGAQAIPDTTEDFASWLRAAQANPAEVWLLEEFLTGREHTFDSVTIEGTRYGRPSPTISRRRWRCCGRRGCSGRSCCRGPSTVPSTTRSSRSAQRPCVPSAYRPRSPTWNGSRVPTDRLRCPRWVRDLGAQLAHDRLQPRHRLLLDVGRAGAARHLQPTEEVYATGTAYLRGQSRPGPHGARRGRDATRARSPGRRRQAPSTRAASTSYEGEGFVTVRHEDTDVVRAALDRIISELRVELVEAE